MTLAAGTRLGPYEITSPIGKGGMGEVYRARDTKLDRDVAIKVLPEEFANDDERLSRFEREAKLLASLNHPNIASIHGFEESDGVKALVLELVEGPTLAERIAEGPIPVEEALPIARQIAEALEAGHEAGIIHRDLKPANIKLREDGTVKVLDYGLAKALEGDLPSGADSELSQSPTLTRQGTQVGVILGTAAYMSPEQAKGKPVDRRTDVWAFGAVVYEMLTGKRAFAGEDVSDTLAAVLRAEPDLDALPAGTPATLRLVLRLCFTKDVKERFQAIGDVRLAMQGSLGIEPAEPHPASGPPTLGLAAVAFVLGAIVAGVVVTRSMGSSSDAKPVTRLSMNLPPGVTLTPQNNERTFALSADGTRLVYAAGGQLYVRDMNDATVEPITTAGSARMPFFSPDGEWVGFYDGELKKVSVSGGAVVTICDAGEGLVRGAQWLPDGTIVFAERAGILRVSDQGGVPEVVLDSFARDFQVLPSGKAMLGTSGRAAIGEQGTVLVNVETGEQRNLIERGIGARYLPSGHLVYLMDGTLFAAPFDIDALEMTSAPVPVIDGFPTFVSNEPRSGGFFSVSDNGTLAYLPATGQNERTLVWVDRQGREEMLAAPPGLYFYIRVSPDGTRAAIDVRDESSGIWLWEFARETMSRLSFGPERENYPTWTPDGERVVFNSVVSSARDITVYWKAADGTGEAEPLTQQGEVTIAYSFTPDGKQLSVARWSNETGSMDLGVMPVGDVPTWTLATPLMELNSYLSPDGAWMAYEAGDTRAGRNDVYVRPFPNVDDGQWLVTRTGGTRPLWSPDGDELFYLNESLELVAVPVETEPTFSVGNPETLFDARAYYNGLPGRSYDIAPDGERFLMIKRGQTVATELVVVLNWFEELKHLVPTNN